MLTAVKAAQGIKYCSFNAARTGGDTNSTSCVTSAVAGECGTVKSWTAEKNEPSLLPLHGWEMPRWHVTQHLALLRPAGSLQKHCTNVSG